MACLFGSGIGCLTPMATPILSFVMDGGHYTPKDIFKWGLLECLCTAIAVAICAPAALDVTASLRKACVCLPAEQAFLLSES